MHEKTVREILGEYSKLAVEMDTLSNDSDLYDAGLTSLTTVTVMLALEDAFDIEFEDHMLTRATFHSVNTLLAAIDELLEARAA